MFARQRARRIKSYPRRLYFVSTSFGESSTVPPILEIPSSFILRDSPELSRRIDTRGYRTRKMILSQEFCRPKGNSSFSYNIPPVSFNFVPSIKRRINYNILLYIYRILHRLNRTHISKLFLFYLLSSL